MSRESMSEPVKEFLAAKPQRLTVDEYQSQIEARSELTPAVREALDKARSIRLGHTVLFYIAGGLTGIPESTKQRYSQLSDFIAEHSSPEVAMFGYAPHLHGTDPVKHPDVSPREVRVIDYLWSSVVADGHFNFWDPIAHGNAIEAGWAEERGIPSVHLVPDGMTTSRLVRGLNNTVDTITYKDFETDGIAQVGEFLDELTAHWPEERR